MNRVKCKSRRPLLIQNVNPFCSNDVYSAVAVNANHRQNCSTSFQYMEQKKRPMCVRIGMTICCCRIVTNLHVSCYECIFGRVNLFFFGGYKKHVMDQQPSSILRALEFTWWNLEHSFFFSRIFDETPQCIFAFRVFFKAFAEKLRVK